jgi:hypothetical protein
MATSVIDYSTAQPCEFVTAARFHGIFESRLAIPHLSVTAAKIKPAPTNPDIHAKTGWTNRKTCGLPVDHAPGDAEHILETKIQQDLPGLE